MRIGVSDLVRIAISDCTLLSSKLALPGARDAGIFVAVEFEGPPHRLVRDEEDLRSAQLWAAHFHPTANAVETLVRQEMQTTLGLEHTDRTAPEVGGVFNSLLQHSAMIGMMHAQLTNDVLQTVRSCFGPDHRFWWSCEMTLMINRSPRDRRF